MVSDLKAQLLQAEEAARLAKEAVEVAVAACFERGVMDTEARLIEEVAMVCSIGPGRSSCGLRP